ncbi:PXMP2/4 family protein 4-like [Diaphorina citri]|uniref:PXMP2/4 family protein 4-like n=1 Tax=Diaphorina citri TaxID=121845 RepID=A0A1S4E875_DIACI|nr:PXMP2/4 family protein 4-like [Diaphorina citri]
MTQILRTMFSQKYLFYTNSLGGGVLMCLGDTIQQTIELYTKVDKRGYDLKRVAHMGIIGLVMGPPQHFFYKYLDKYLPKRSGKSIALKLCFDQAIISPVCIIIFLYGMGILEAKPKDEIKEEIRDKFLVIYTTDCLLWPPCQFVNFTYISPQYRVMYVNLITIVYDIMLSYIKYNDDVFGLRGEEIVHHVEKDKIEKNLANAVDKRLESNGNGREKKD